MMPLDDSNTPTARFSSTVNYYVKYRPSYPEAVLKLLQEQCQLKPGATFADIGSGTGIFTELLLKAGYRVFAVEPNPDMREQAECLLSPYPNFVSIRAPAEATTLKTHSVDAITAATAFHWFEQQETQTEFRRILKPGGTCMLLWNIRDHDAAPLMRAYQLLLQQYGTDYAKVAAESVGEAEILHFFNPGKVDIAVFPQQQLLNWEAFLGRLLSASYTPKPGAPNFDALLAAAKAVFERYQQGGVVEFYYLCKCYYGRL